MEAEIDMWSVLYMNKTYLLFPIKKIRIKMLEIIYIFLFGGKFSNY